MKDIKVRKLTVVLSLLFVLFTISSCAYQNKEVNKYFYNIYDNKENLDEYCTSHNDYYMEIAIEETVIRLRLKKMIRMFGKELFRCMIIQKNLKQFPLLLMEMKL